MKTITLKIICLQFAWVGILGLGLVGCGGGIYSKIPPEYNLVENQDKRVLLWVESPRSAVADADAPEKLEAALRDYLIVHAKVNPANIYLHTDTPTTSIGAPPTPEAMARQAGAGLVLLVRIDTYELMPMNIRNFYYGRMLTYAILLDVQASQPVWPRSGRPKAHDIVIEMGQGERGDILTRMAASTAHCIIRNLYPIVKMHYKNSDERISLQEAFEMETF